MLYKSEHCDYASDRKYNKKKHEKNIHEKFLHEAAHYSAHCDYSNKKLRDVLQEREVASFNKF